MASNKHKKSTFEASFHFANTHLVIGQHNRLRGKQCGLMVVLEMRNQMMYRIEYLLNLVDRAPIDMASCPDYVPVISSVARPGASLEE